MRHVFDAGDYDHNGLLTVPMIFWAAVVFSLKTWGLFLVAQACESRQLALFDGLYPSTTAIIIGLLLGVPAMALMFCYPLRGRIPRLAGMSYLGVIAATLLSMAYDAFAAYHADGAQAGLWMSILAFDSACWLGLLPDRRIRAVFFSTGPARWAHMPVPNVTTPHQHREIQK
ncbi:DUF2919 family protein [Salmonella enterica]|nr:DUF2919 family protein [Salmonella enterica]EAA9599147.1 DUF2919 family protein [Salmonella enterica]EAO9641840.1 DUF2919 family protein [Salmonella enterica]EAQ8932629.1 DUF2919 family protein [Salmonella enterica]EFO8357470.1 DUF2919 domain-containing protein [Salmonella enterica]